PARPTHPPRPTHQTHPAHPPHLTYPTHLPSREDGDLARSRNQAKNSRILHGIPLELSGIARPEGSQQCSGHIGICQRHCSSAACGSRRPRARLRPTGIPPDETSATAAISTVSRTTTDIATASGPVNATA